MSHSIKTQERLPQAPRAPLPELAEFLAPLRVQLMQGPSADTLRQYLTGLLSEHPNKNCDTLAEIVPETSEQQFHHLLTDRVWDETALNRQRSARMQTIPSEGDGVLIFDDTGFEKQGRHSVGVARQYTGTAGKLTNCQVTVNGHYAERTLAWPVATRLYLPQAWAEDAPRRQQAQVPQAVTFQTKAELALALLDEATACGVRHACVTCDADYGDNPPFLNGLEERQERHVVAVRANFSVTLGRGQISPVLRADEVLAAQPLQGWQSIAWSAGATGWWRAKFLALRGWRVDGAGTRHVGWLLGQRPGRGQSGDWKYYWSDFPADTSLAVMVEYAHRRHGVEQYHEEAKTELGWDQYQGRRWDGFHRHAMTVMLSYSFLIWLEGHERAHRPMRGRRRAAFSPSSGPPPRAAAGNPSPGERMAALCRHP
ncbi:MAG: IS701 family transposase [Candidatus Binatia bacterium]